MGLCEWYVVVSTVKKVLRFYKTLSVECVYSLVVCSISTMPKDITLIIEFSDEKSLSSSKKDLESTIDVKNSRLKSNLPL